MLWVERVAEELLRLGKEHTIATGTSISGIPHIGNASDVIRGDFVRRALEERKAKVRLIWVADDVDPFRRVPLGCEQLEGWLGFPVCSLPDPEGCHEGWVEHHCSRFLEGLRKFSAEPEVWSSRELYRRGELADEVEKLMEARDEVVRILNLHRERKLPPNYIPWQPICENCGKISTTKPLELLDGAVAYSCDSAILNGKRVEGCGHRSESSFERGEGKLPWRLEWAARWKHFRVTCEPFGKEHAAAGGSYWTAKLISERILNWRAPFPIVYEFFTLRGEKMSSSRGNILTLDQWDEVCEPEVLRFLMLKKPRKQRDIQLEKLPQLVEEYDAAEQEFFSWKRSDASRMYELAQLRAAERLGVPFTLCAMLAKLVGQDIEEAERRLERLGYKGFSKHRLMERLRRAGRWCELYAPSHLKFELKLHLSGEELEKLRNELGAEVRLSLLEIAKAVESRPSPEELHSLIYRVARSSGAEAGKVFEAIYLLLLGKREGPKAASLLLALDEELVKRRLKLEA